MDFKNTIPKFDYFHDLVQVTFETPKLDVVVDVTDNDMTARGWTNSNEFEYHLKPSEKEIIKLWIIKQEYKRRSLKRFKDNLELLQFTLMANLQSVKSMLDESDDDIRWEIENNIKLEYDIIKIEKLLKQNYGN